MASILSKSFFLKESPIGFYYYHKINLEKSICRIPEYVLMFRSKDFSFDYHNFFIFISQFTYVNFKLSILKLTNYLMLNYFLNELKNNSLLIFLSFLFYFLKKYFYKYFYYNKKSLHFFLSDRIDPLFCVNLRIHYSIYTWLRESKYYFFWSSDFFFFNKFRSIVFFNPIKLFYIINYLKIKYFKTYGWSLKNNYFFCNLSDFTYSFFELKSKKNLICDRIRMPFFLTYLGNISYSSKFFCKNHLKLYNQKKKNLFAYKLKFIDRFGLNKELVDKVLSEGTDYSMKKLKNFKEASVYEYSNLTGKRLLFLEYNVDGLYKKSKFENIITLNLGYKFKRYRRLFNKRTVVRLKMDFFEKNPLLDPNKFIENTEEIYYLSNPAARFAIDKDDKYLELLENVTDTKIPDEYLADIFEDDEHSKKIIESVTEDLK